MRSFLGRGVVRVFSGVLSAFVLILAFLKWETSYATIPGDVSGQVTSLIRIGGTGWFPVLTMFVVGILLFAVALGPEKLGAWQSAAFNYMNREALLRVDNEQLRQGKEELERRLTVYEGRGGSKIVARAENIGPVSSEVWAPEQATGRGSKRFCVVPLKPYDTERAFFDEPAATIRVEGADDVYLVNVSYDVQGYGPKLFNGTYGMRVNVEVQVLDGDGKVVNRVHVHSGTTASEWTWRHKVNGTATIFGLLAGNYGLNVLDYVEEGTHRDTGPRTYRDMRLLVNKLS